jgi:hypothetical protein
VPLQIPTDFRRWATVGGGHSLQNLLQRGFVSPSALKRSLSHLNHLGCSRHRSSANPPSASALRCVEPSRDPRPRTKRRGRSWPHRSMHGQERPQPVTKVRVNVPRLPSALPSRDRPRVDMRFTSEAARSGSLVPPATSPLTASMPSTVGCRDLPALSAGGGRRCACICDVERADW